MLFGRKNKRDLKLFDLRMRRNERKILEKHTFLAHRGAVLGAWWEGLSKNNPTTQRKMRSGRKPTKIPGNDISKTDKSPGK
jgi:hypothetical protein